MESLQDTKVEGEDWGVVWSPYRTPRWRVRIGGSMESLQDTKVEGEDWGEYGVPTGHQGGG